VRWERAAATLLGILTLLATGCDELGLSGRTDGARADLRTLGVVVFQATESVDPQAPGGAAGSGPRFSRIEATRVANCSSVWRVCLKVGPGAMAFTRTRDRPAAAATSAAE
jgi:hypothetical protein